MPDFTNWITDVKSAPYGREVIALLANGAVRVMRRTDGVWRESTNGGQYAYPVVAYAVILSVEPSNAD